MFIHEKELQEGNRDGQTLKKMCLMDKPNLNNVMTILDLASCRILCLAFPKLFYITI